MRMYLAYTDEGQKFYIGEAVLAAYGPDILTPLHRVDLPPRPEPVPLTEDDLAGFERYCATTDLPPYIEDTIVPALVAEVRRLRAENAELEAAYNEADDAARYALGSL